MCEIKLGEQLFGPWARPNIVPVFCPRASRFWVQRASMNLTVCTQHLPGTIARFKATDHQTAHTLYHLGPRDDVVVKEAFIRADGSKGYR